MRFFFLKLKGKNLTLSWLFYLTYLVKNQEILTLKSCLCSFPKLSSDGEFSLWVFIVSVIHPLLQSLPLLSLTSFLQIFHWTFSQASLQYLFFPLSQPLYSFSLSLSCSSFPYLCFLLLGSWNLNSSWNMGSGKFKCTFSIVFSLRPITSSWGFSPALIITNHIWEIKYTEVW